MRGSRRLEKQLHHGKRRETDNVTWNVHRQRVVQNMPGWKLVMISGFEGKLTPESRSNITTTHRKDLECLFFKLILTSCPTDLGYLIQWGYPTGWPQTGVWWCLRYHGTCCLASSWYSRIARFPLDVVFTHGNSVFMCPKPQEHPKLYQLLARD